MSNMDTAGTENAKEMDKATLLYRVANDFRYHKPDIGAVARFAEIRNRAKELAATMVNYCPLGRELDHALVRLEEAVMHANAAIARQVEPEIEQ